MESGDPDVRRDARTVEIGTAVVLGGLIAVVPSGVLRLVGWAVDVGGSGWGVVSRTVWLASLVVAGFVLVLWLLRARRRGL